MSDINWAMCWYLMALLSHTASSFSRWVQERFVYNKINSKMLLNSTRNTELAYRINSNINRNKNKLIHNDNTTQRVWHNSMIVYSKLDKNHGTLLKYTVKPINVGTSVYWIFLSTLILVFLLAEQSTKFWIFTIHYFQSCHGCEICKIKGHAKIWVLQYLLNTIFFKILYKICICIYIYIYMYMNVHIFHTGDIKNIRTYQYISQQ